MFDLLVRIVEETVGVFLDASMYVLLGLLAAGLLHAFCPAEKIMRGLGPDTLRSVVRAALLGIPLPLCSCAVIPTAIAIHRKGASKGATISFLISTPETGADSITLSFAVLDPLISAFRPLAALCTAIIAGVLENVLGGSRNASKGAVRGAGDDSTPCDCGHCGEHAPAPPIGLLGRARIAAEYGYGELLTDLAPWLAIGLFLAGLVGAAVPKGFFEEYAGTGLLAMLAILGVSMPLYICATASTPLAAMLVAKGLSPGAALVLLLAGPATNVATIFMVSQYLGRRSVLIYLTSIGVVSIALGLLLNWLYAVIGLEASGSTWKGGELLPFPARVSCALILLILLVRGTARHLRPPRL